MVSILAEYLPGGVNPARTPRSGGPGLNARRSSPRFVRRLSAISRDRLVVSLAWVLESGAPSGADPLARFRLAPASAHLRRWLQI
jgi:hypothetical protein